MLLKREENLFVADSATWQWMRRRLFNFDPESTHKLAIGTLRVWQNASRFQRAPALARRSELKRQLLGLDFPNPLGLAAGFDKNASCLWAWELLGFGFVEVGTATVDVQEGNPRPRIFRFAEEQALLNRMGFNNGGAQMVALQIARVRRRFPLRIPIGVNIGKSKRVAIDEAPGDYEACFRIVADVADYITVNISSPNTQGLRSLQEEDRLHRLLERVQAVNQKRQSPRPLLLKLSPDLNEEALLSCVDVALSHGVDGFVVSNSTVSRSGIHAQKDLGPGGISGRPLFQKSTQDLACMARHVGPNVVLIGLGGVMNASDARTKLMAGAHLVQAYTGFVYGGPRWPVRVLEGLGSFSASNHFVEQRGGDSANKGTHHIDVK